MKKLLTIVMIAFLVLSCNAQAPQAVNEEAEKFATENSLSTDQKAKLVTAANEVDSLKAELERLYQLAMSTEESRRAEVVSAEQMEGIVQKAVSLMIQTCRDNRDNLIPAFFLPQIADLLSYEELKEFCAEGTGYHDHPSMQVLLYKLEALGKRAPGAMFTDLEEPDLNGQMHKLSEYVGHGNYVLVDFWASWCGPCRAEMPNVKAAYDKYRAKGFNVVGLSFDQKKDAWEKAVKDMNLDWVHLSDLKGWQTVAGSVYGIKAIPASILVDPEGKIVAIDLRGADLENKLAEIYGE